MSNELQKDLEGALGKCDSNPDCSTAEDINGMKRHLGNLENIN